jgi:hypothetical protein
MIRNKLQCFLLITILSTCLAHAEILNGSFEDGDGTSGWNIDAPQDGFEIEDFYRFVSTTLFDYSVEWSPVHGNYFALLKSGLTVVSYVKITQPVTVYPGDIIQGWYFFSTDDYMPYNDHGEIALIGDNDFKIVLAHVEVNDVNSFASMQEWEQFSYEIGPGEGGTYDIVCSVNDYYDSILTSYFGVDDLTIIKKPIYAAIKTDRNWTYSNDPNQVCFRVNASVSDINDALHNETYTYTWQAVTDPNNGKSMVPVFTDCNLPNAVFATPNEPSLEQRSYKIQCTIRGSQFGNLGVAEIDVNSVPVLRGDINFDQMVNAFDFAHFASSWTNETCPVCDPADFDHNGVIDFADLETFTLNWLTDRRPPVLEYSQSVPVR